MNLEKLIPIKTERLLLDKFKPDDWKDYYQMEISPERHKYNRNLFEPKSEEKIKEYVLKKLSTQEFKEIEVPCEFAIRLSENQQLIGFMGINDGKLLEQEQIELYFTINKSFWNNGFATEALKGMIKFCFESVKVHKIVTGCDIENLASKRVMEKAGLRFECYWRKDRKRNNQWTDGLGFGILEEDFI